MLLAECAVCTSFCRLEVRSSTQRDAGSALHQTVKPERLVRKMTHPDGWVLSILSTDTHAEMELLD